MNPASFFTFVLFVLAVSSAHAAPWRSDRAASGAVVHFRGQALGGEQQAIVRTLLDRTKQGDCALATQRITRNAATAPARTPELQRINSTVGCEDIRRELFDTRSKTTLWFHAGRWVGFTGDFPARDFTQVLTAMTRDYGPPAQRLNHGNDNRHQEILWQTPQGTLRLIQRSEFSAEVAQFSLLP